MITKFGVSKYIVTGLIAMVSLCLGGTVLAQGTYYDAPSTPIDLTKFGFGGKPGYTNYAHDTRLWIPDDVTVIRGVIVLGNGAGGDQRGRAAEKDWQTLARGHGFALMGTHGYVCYGSTAIVDKEVSVLLGDLAWYATASGHPEVANLPFVLAGWSGGGQIANGINTRIPERVIAFIANKGSHYLAPSSEAALKTPGILVAGQLDGQVNRDGITGLFEKNRPRGALWADAFEENTGHAEGNVNGMFFTFFDHAIRARYPAGVTPLAGPVKLLDLVETNGWLAAEPSANNGLAGKIYSYANYPGVKSNACWLMDADVANLYRGFATYAPAVTVSIEGGPCYSSGQAIKINVSVDSNAFPRWTIANVYDGAFKLGTVTNGKSSVVSAIRPSGGGGITAIAFDASKNERTSIPRYFVVKNPVAKRPGNLLEAGKESRSRRGNKEASINDGDFDTFVVTFDGKSLGNDWFAVTLDKVVTIRSVVFGHGKVFPDGGWFDSSAGKPKVQVQLARGGTWQTVGEISSYPETTVENNGGLSDGQKFTCKLAKPVNGIAVRVTGKPSGGKYPGQTFSSCSELQAY